MMCTVLLCQAVESGNCFSLQHLLDIGGDPNLADELGRTPLHIAAKTRDRASASLLLKKGASKGAAEKVCFVNVHQKQNKASLHVGFIQCDMYYRMV